MTNQIFFSLLLFMAFIAYMQIGARIFPFRYRSSTNRVLMAICIALGIWSFSFSIANSAGSYETALMWRRISAIGWGLIYALILHFFLIVLKIKGFVKKPWFYVLLYLPAVVSVVIFGLHPTVAPGQYNLIYTSSGWSNQSVNNWIDWLFNLYFIAYVLVSFSLAVYTRWKSQAVTKKVANTILITGLGTFVLATTTDIVLSIYFPGYVPQIAPLILLLPVISIFYSVKKNSLITIEKMNHTTIEGSILNEVTRSKLYSNMGAIYIYGAFASFAGLYFMEGAHLQRVFSVTGTLLVLGLVIIFINHREIDAKHKDIIIACITAISMPFFQLFFAETAGMTAWVIPGTLIIFSILINNRFVLIMNSTAALFSATLTGILMPEARVDIGAVDHFVRITLMVIFILLANYTNQVFIKRLKENEDQVRRQKLIAYISTEFATVNKSNVEAKFMESLQLYTEDFSIDLSYVYLLSEDGRRARCTYARGLESDNEYSTNRDEIDLDEFPWWMSQLNQSEGIHIQDMSTLPAEAVNEHKALIGQALKSLMFCPIMDEDRPIGVMGFGAVEKNRLWTESATDIAGIIAQHFAVALTKIKSNDAIEFMAYYDALTGLPNRTLFNNRLDKEIELSERTNLPIGVLFVDLDSFKSINDTLGHDSGDELLKSVAAKLSRSLRKHDTVSRFGGDEFLLMVKNINHTDDLTQIADNIIKIFEKPTVIGEHEFFITASVGISVYPNDGTSSTSLIKNADMAMYVAKDLGKNRYSFSSSLLKEDVLKKMKLTNSLYRAQERNELELYYQPQINTHTGRIVGLEALLRWNHPELGLVPPLSFIYLAEQTGLIVPIGEWVMKTACEQTMSWQRMGLDPIRMAVNLSVEQFRSDILVETVQNILDQTGLQAKYLELEITESIAIKGTNHIIDVLTKLKKLGISISIDDFGTEYSSLSRIKVMPIDRIKMDMHFVQSISNSSKDDAIVRIIIQLAQSLNLEVIAEGVETEPQLDFLRNQSCDEVQGYYYYKPMKASEIEKILIANKEGDGILEVLEYS